MIRSKVLRARMVSNQVMPQRQDLLGYIDLGGGYFSAPYYKHRQKNEEKVGKPAKLIRVLRGGSNQRNGRGVILFRGRLNCTIHTYRSNPVFDVTYDRAYLRTIWGMETNRYERNNTMNMSRHEEFYLWR